jgi:hypothetical protein
MSINTMSNKTKVTVTSKKAAVIEVEKYRKKEASATDAKAVKQPTPAEQYGARCAKLGSTLVVADKLGVQPITIIRRASDSSPITKENWLALEALEHQAIRQSMTAGPGVE